MNFKYKCSEYFERKYNLTLAEVEEYLKEKEDKKESNSVFYKTPADKFMEEHEDEIKVKLEELYIKDKADCSVGYYVIFSEDDNKVNEEKFCSKKDMKLFLRNSKKEIIMVYRLNNETKESKTYKTKKIRKWKNKNQ